VRLENCAPVDGMPREFLGALLNFNFTLIRSAARRFPCSIVVGNAAKSCGLLSYDDRNRPAETPALARSRGEPNGPVTVHLASLPAHAPSGSTSPATTRSRQRTRRCWRVIARGTARRCWSPNAASIACAHGSPAPGARFPPPRRVGPGAMAAISDEVIGLPRPPRRVGAGRRSLAFPYRLTYHVHGRARRGTSGALYPQTALAGLNSHPRPCVFWDCCRA